MIQDKELRQLANSDIGITLAKYLDERVKDMSDLSKIKTYDELLGKQEAVKILKELFSFLEKAREEQPIITKTDYK